MTCWQDHTAASIADIADIPQDDPAVYDMLCRANSVGVFQVESRAQMSMLPRLKPRKFYDLVIEVAIVRPGPIQGDMVHPYLRRRDGHGAGSITRPRARARAGRRTGDRCSARPLGVPLFQEQAMQIAIEAAKFTPEEANGLRRAMATFRHNWATSATIPRQVRRRHDRAAATTPDFAERCFKQIEGFG